MTDFKIIFTDTLSRKFAIAKSLQFPPRLNGVATLPREVVTKIASTESTATADEACA